MRIALFSEAQHLEAGGTPRAVLTMARALARRGHAVFLAAPRGETLDEAGMAPPPGDHGGSVSIVGLPGLWYAAAAGRARTALPTGMATLRCRTWAPDVIHTHGPYGAGLDALAAARLLRRPLVGTYHPPPTRVGEDGPGPGERRSPGLSRYVRWYYNRCDAVTAASEALAATWHAAGLRVPLRVLPDALPFDPRRARRARLDAKRALGLPGFTVLHVGRLAAQGGIDELIRAIPSLITRIPRVSVLLAGAGAAEPSLRRLIDRLQVNTHVRLLEHLTPGRFPEAHAASDVYVTATPADGPMAPTLEAMTEGLPVVFAQGLNTREPVDPPPGIRVHSGDSAGLAEAILGLFRAPRDAGALAAAGRAYTARFDPDVIAPEWECLYLEVMALTRRPGVPSASSPARMAATDEGRLDLSEVGQGQG